MAKANHFVSKLAVQDWIPVLSQILITISVLKCCGASGLQRVNVRVENSLLYDSRAPEFKYGFAIPGELCIPPDEQKSSWEEVVNEKIQIEKNKMAKKLLSQICGQWMGYFCDAETRRCECVGDDLTWEHEPEETRGCHALIGTGCNDSVVCVNGAECLPNENLTEPNSTSKEVPGTCTCVYPGFRNCSRMKEMAYEIVNSISAHFPPSMYSAWMLIISISYFSLN